MRQESSAYSKIFGNQDLLGGRINVVFDGINGTISLIYAGNVRAIGVTTKERMPMVPGVPTFADGGLPGFEASSWLALFTRSAVYDGARAAWRDGCAVVHCRSPGSAR